MLLLVDEIITGFRLAAGGAQEYFGVTADLATYSKVVGAGLPLGIIAGRDDVMRVLGTTGDAARDLRERVYYGGTFNGNVQAMAVGIAVLELPARAPGDVRGGSTPAARRSAQRHSRVAARDRAIPVTVLGEAVALHDADGDGPVRSHRDLAGERSAGLSRNVSPPACASGVFLPNAHFGLVSAAHTADDVAAIVAAHAHVFGELRDAGLF